MICDLPLLLFANKNCVNKNRGESQIILRCPCNGVEMLIIRKQHQEDNVFEYSPIFLSIFKMWFDSQPSRKSIRSYRYSC